ncbi:unnamed protein product, partial [Echinostoma caproni]|uniref:Ig-like domain-containing protein n=1 Tax=Echinostoma caproni TaxID=27848 RepID=A0A183AMX4_9TREM
FRRIHWYPIIFDELSPAEQNEGFACEVSEPGEVCVWHRDFPDSIMDGPHEERDGRFVVSFDGILRGRDSATVFCIIGSPNALYNVSVVVFQSRLAVSHSEYANRSLDRTCMQTLIVLSQLRDRFHPTVPGIFEFCNPPATAPICPWPVIFTPMNETVQRINCAARGSPVPTVSILWNGCILTENSGAIHGISVHGYTAELRVQELFPRSSNSENAGLLTCIAQAGEYELTRHYLLYSGSSNNGLCASAVKENSLLCNQSE